MTVRAVRKVEFHAGAKEEVERCFVDRRGGRGAVVGRRVIMPGRVHMRAVVGAERQHLDRPAFAVGQIFARQSREKHRDLRSEEHTSELQSLMRISYAVFCLKKKTKYKNYNHNL